MGAGRGGGSAVLRPRATGPARVLEVVRALVRASAAPADRRWAVPVRLLPPAYGPEATGGDSQDPCGGTYTVQPAPASGSGMASQPRRYELRGRGVRHR